MTTGENIEKEIITQATTRQISVISSWKISESCSINTWEKLQHTLDIASISTISKLVTWLVQLNHLFIVIPITSVICSGGGYLLSKEALRLLVEELIPKNPLCRKNDEGAEDFEMGTKIELI